MKEHSETKYNGVQPVNTKEERILLLKDYLKRISEGEALESVRKDFVRNFKDVDAAEIMRAEQEMLAGGMPLVELQKLCDIHAALFYGKTKEERIANAENAVNASVFRKERESKTRKLSEIQGHPLWLFMKENEALQDLLEKIEGKVEYANHETLATVREIAIHYAKKGDLLYPLLKVRYGISGPSDVMWTVDDEIRDELAALAKKGSVDEALEKRFLDVLVRVREMIYKENNILFPNCAGNFTESDWIGIYHDQKDYGVCFGVKPKVWQLAEEKENRKESKVTSQEIVFGGGHMTVAQLEAMLNTIPLEITFVDGDNINRFFNEGPKDFKRPQMALDREVFSCHPPKVESKVRHIIESFRAGTMDEVPVWMEKNGKNMLVKYMAVRNHKQEYLGTLELVQDLTFAKEYFLSHDK